ncbi:disulfide bond formation protein DsbA [Mycobacterium sp. Root135]|uniref:DsbA family protein n=1 Tax=Mycobacterium sp. Root135 TaxID=1736457 RepID=UPI000701FCBB|nr:thioredoxin domain-containing protein [Mycobacterium sp. Root135]KQY04008.1 disulfide bond formation protein DsbA [Mycobacterium sp. Root135]
MPRTTARRIWVTAAAIVAVVFGAVIVLISRRDDGPDRALADTSAPAVVRDDSRRLNSPPDAVVTFVEFLDFECEGCRAAYPVVEQLRADYGDRVEFVLRYFPLPGHVNGERAARAVEAAAQQGRLEAMYRTMYETQAQWGERRTPADDVFRGFAAELGLDMAAYDAAYADPATAERIQVDVDDGMALGVQGTPTFFVNGEQVSPRAVDDLRTAIENGLR